MINILGLQDIPYKDKKALVMAACQMYKRLYAIKGFINEKKTGGQLSLNDKIVDAGRESFKSISLFETLIGLLNVDHALIIKKDFIDDKHDEKWYENHWSKTTYYKIKKEALDAFLFLFYV